MEAILCLALSNALAATVLAAIVAVFARCCRRPAVRHALWLLVLLKLITPPLIPLSISWPRTEANAVLPDESLPSAIVIPSPSEARQPMPVPSEADEPSTLGEADSVAASLTFADMWIHFVMAVWLGGSLIWWSLAAVRLRKFQRLLRQARPASVEVQEQARRLATLLRLRRCPPVAFVSAALSPLLWALGFSPRLLVPAELWQKLAAEQQDTLLAHELAHLRRGDHWIRRLELVVLGLYWWHPVVWWARRRLQEAEEECCDAVVVALLPDAAPAYASALVETVAFLSQSRAAALVGASGAGQVPLLKRRLTMILTATPARRSARAGFWLVLGVGALLLPWAPGLAQTEAPKEGERVQSSVSESDPLLVTEGIVDPPVKSAVGTLAESMRNCVACHQAESVHSRDLQRKPQTWREAHDEAVRLMDEVRRRQDQLREAARRLPAAAEPYRGEQIEKLQDEIELLKVQVRLREAHLTAAKAVLEEYQKRLSLLTTLLLRQPGAVSQDEVNQTKLSVLTQEAQVQFREAELQEPLVRLKQTERRLARLQRPAEHSPRLAPKPSPAASSTEQDKQRQLKELERKIESLQKEIRDLRREMEPKKPSGPGRSSATPADDRLWQNVGLRLRSLGGAIRSGDSEFRGGMIVEAIRGASPAQRSGLRVGDILVGLAKWETVDKHSVEHVLERPEVAASPLKFYALRGKELKDGTIRLGER